MGCDGMGGDGIPKDARKKEGFSVRLYGGDWRHYTMDGIGRRFYIGWVNPDSGNSGSYTPTKTYQVDSGQYCREFQQTITVGGQTEDAYGTACREPDGSWRIVGN